MALSRISEATQAYTLPDGWRALRKLSVSELSAVFEAPALTDEQRADLEYLGVTIGPDGYARTHTTRLANLYAERNKPGVFKTISPGTRLTEPNCFIFAISGGGWHVIRYGRGCHEAAGYWTETANGWTRCRFGVAADVAKAANHAGCVETDDGYYATGEQLTAFLGALCVESSPVSFGTTITQLKKRRKVQLTYKPPKGCNDDPPPHWGKNSKGAWIRLIDDPTPLEDTDFHCRVYKTPGTKKADHVYFDRNNVLRLSDRQEVLDSLLDKGLDANLHIQRATNRPWTYSLFPFAGEYPGGVREHAMHAAQFACEPVAGTLEDCPTFRMILRHCGGPLDEAIQNSEDCKKLGITSGEEYLIAWVRCLFHHPEKPLPYLGLVGPQEGGKSALHEAIALCMTSRGVTEVDEALKSTTGFNAGMEGAVLCVIEETKIGQSGTAYDRLKKFITAKRIGIRKMHTDAYSVPNFTHWIQCTNNMDGLPIFRGDTRITAWRVPAIELEKQIAREEITIRLTQEMPKFLGFILNTPAIVSNHRLTLPAVRTEVFDDAINDPIADCLTEIGGGEFSTQQLYESVFSIDPTYVASSAALGKQLRDYDCVPTKRSHWKKLI